MNSSEELNYIYNHQRLLFQETTNPSEAANVMRQCLLQTYNASLNQLDNRAALELLKINLDKYTEHIEDHNILDSFADVTTMTNNASAISSNLKDVNINRLMDSLPCNNENNSILCHNAHVNEEAVQEFMSLFSYNQDTSNEAKVRKIAKSFAPKSCIQKNKIFKTLSTGSLESKVYGSPNEKLKEPDTSSSSFKTAFEELQLQNQKKIGSSSVSHTNLCSQKRKLGTRRSFRNKFVSPLLSNNLSDDEAVSKSDTFLSDQAVDERLKNIEPRMVELIRSEIMDIGARVVWDDIAGLEFAKTAIQEAVIWPLLRPDIFTGLRKPPKGILLFGPPGTGKTLIGKCIASQSNSTFFSISASSLTSKWIGDGEKMVRALFTVACCHQPAVIFIDEVDSLLSQRNETEHESSRRIKTEFLVQLDGATTDNDERLLVVGATNRPQELDEAARRRFVKRLYIPLPDCEARLQLVTRLMATEKNILNEGNIKEIAQLTNGYSGADIKNLCSEASLGPIRSIDMNLIHCIQTAEVRPVNMDDFLKAVSRVKASVSPNDLNQYLKWNTTFGSDNCL